MNYLSVEEITKSYGDRVLFEALTFGIDQGQKVAIVAKNGTGKTTILRCLLGKESVDEGRIVFRKDVRIAFMEQSDELNESNSIFDEVFSHDLPELQAVKAYNKAMRDNDEEGITQTFEAVSDLNAWDIEVRVNQILSVLKLENTGQLVGTLSGGQKKRVALAKVLIAEPDFLILDEPTNHLDLDMIEWLEEYLTKSNSTILMVTHDRYFLEVVCDTILELDNKTLYKYKGNFSYFLREEGRTRGADICRLLKRQKINSERNWIGCVDSQKHVGPNRKHEWMLFMIRRRLPNNASTKMNWRFQ